MENIQYGFDLAEEAKDEDKPLFDPDEIRQDCRALIAEAKANTESLQWDIRKLKYNQVLFPNVASWIPDEQEREQLCSEFALQCEQVEALLEAQEP
jgi:hypothetical protein